MVDNGAVSKALAGAYGLAGVRLQRVMSGVATVNFVADADDARRVFVKVYQPEADLAKERILSRERTTSSRSCGAWVCYSAASIYPFDDLVDGRALLPEPLNRYAVDRHHALVAVLERVDEIEAALREVVLVNDARRR